MKCMFGARSECMKNCHSKIIRAINIQSHSYKDWVRNWACAQSLVNLYRGRSRGRKMKIGKNRAQVALLPNTGKQL